MPFQIVHNDITMMHTDAIVNAANSQLKQGGGVCGAIFKAAGEDLLREECNKIGSCNVGHAVITSGYNLSAQYIIHAVGPIWKGGHQNEANFLAMAYRNSLKLAKEYKLKSISFPLISSGIYGYPKDEALQVAISTISEFLLKNEMEIFLVVFDRKAITLSEKLFHEIDHYINTYYEDFEDKRTQNQYNRLENDNIPFDRIENICNFAIKGVITNKRKSSEESLYEPLMNYSMSNTQSRNIEDIVQNLDETFSQMLFRLIDEKGISDVEVYKKANMDRKLFSKIRSKKDYQPKKSTALALAIALELNLDETMDLLMKAGYTLSMSNKFDLIIRYYIERESYDMFLINETLFVYEQALLGS